MDDTIRAFIAIELPKQLKEDLSGIQKILRNSGADVKWVEPENIHLTIKFLGNITQERAKEISKGLDGITKDTKYFNADLSEIGAFPRLNSPRVIWIGVKEGKDILKKLADDIEQDLIKKGFQKQDRPFGAHITIGRVRSPKGKERLKAQIENLNKSQQPITKHKLQITKITLFQSNLMPTGPIYTKLHEAHLETI